MKHIRNKKGIIEIHTKTVQPDTFVPQKQLEKDS